MLQELIAFKGGRGIFLLSKKFKQNCKLKKKRQWGYFAFLVLSLWKWKRGDNRLFCQSLGSKDMVSYIVGFRLYLGVCNLGISFSLFQFLRDNHVEKCFEWFGWDSAILSVIYFNSRDYGNWGKMLISCIFVIQNFHSERKYDIMGMI